MSSSIEGGAKWLVNKIKGLLKLRSATVMAHALVLRYLLAAIPMAKVFLYLWNCHLACAVVISRGWMQKF